MNWLLGIGIGAGLLGLAILGLSRYGACRWKARTRVLTRKLDAARTISSAAGSARFDARELVGLPAPVQRYFLAVLKVDQPIITAATLELCGRINLSATAQRWKPFISRQRVVTHRPGFVWDALVFMFPSVTASVVDSYVAGRGLLHAAVLGVFPVANMSGGGEIARGEFMRLFCRSRVVPQRAAAQPGRAMGSSGRQFCHRNTCGWPDHAHAAVQV